MLDTRRSLFMAGMLAAAFLVAACSGDKDDDRDDGGDDKKESSQAQVSGGTGDTIIVEMYSDALGNYYKPNDIEAERGDVVRFVLKSGVHNVHFLADSNEIKTGLPPASEMLQLPDQTYDLQIDLKEGHYYFQCDPHAALGMKGRLEVED
jgi:plastocyanin